MSVRSISRAAAALALVLSVAACSAIRFGGGPELDLTGSWRGSVTAQGQRIPGTLSLEQAGHDLDAAFASPTFDLQSQGAGRVEEDGSFWIELRYDLECPGNARLEGSVADDGQSLTGTLDATDCTGTVTGSFSFTLQAGDGGGRDGDALTGRTAVR